MPTGPRSYADAPPHNNPVDELRPEYALIIAVIKVAMDDYLKGDKSAEHWLSSHYFNHWCSWLDLEPDYIRRKLVRIRASGKKLRGWNTRP